MTESDVNFAIKLMLTSFIGSQKLSVQKLLRTKFMKYFRDEKENMKLLTYAVQKLVKEAKTYELMRKSSTKEGAEEEPVTIFIEDVYKKGSDLQVEPQTIERFLYDEHAYIQQNQFMVDRERGVLVKYF